MRCCMTVLIVNVRLPLRTSDYIILVESFSQILAACAIVGILLWPCRTAVCGRACRLPHSLHHDLRRCRAARRHPFPTMLHHGRRPPRRAVRCTLCRVSHNDRVLAAAWAPRRSQCCLSVLFALHGFRRGPWADPLERKPLLCLNFHRHPPHCSKQTGSSAIHS